MAAKNIGKSMIDAGEVRVAVGHLAGCTDVVIVERAGDIQANIRSWNAR